MVDRRRGTPRNQGMRIDLSEIIERGEGAFLLFPMKTRVAWVWHAGGRAHKRQRGEGYLVPVADSIIREQLKNVHVGCEASPETGGLPEEDADQLDQIFRLAGMPFEVDRGEALRESTENAVAVRFPGEDEIAIQFSRYRKWQPFWGRSATFIWWQCESEQEYQQRLEREWRERGGSFTIPRLPIVLNENDDADADDDPEKASNHT